MQRRTTWEIILEHLAQVLTDVLQEPVKASEIVAPPDRSYGDVSFGCFRLAKLKSLKPPELAAQIVSSWPKEDSVCDAVSAVGPYVNFKLESATFIQRVMVEIDEQGTNFGSSDDGKGQTVLAEYAQMNTHKEVHVGHLRNLTLGRSLVHLLNRAGWKAIPVSYHGDVGAHVAKCLWHLVRSNGVKDPTALTTEDVERLLVQISPDQKNGKYLGTLYSESTKILEDHPEWKEEVSEVQRRLESYDPVWDALWKETKEWSVQELARIFSDLGVKLDRQYYESEVVDEGQRMVDKLLVDGVAKESQGAMVVDLEAEKLGVFLIRKSDGTSLYATKDLALAYLKLKEFPELERSLLIVDLRQAFYFKQLFKTLEVMKFPKAQEYVGYEFVTLTTGAMSSREGNIVTFQSFYDEVLAFARAETVQRHPEWPEGKIAHTAWCLAMSGLKFGMLKQDSDKIFVFDLARAMAFDGDTGPYVQYAAIRFQSILKKSGEVSEEGINEVLHEPAEHALAVALAQFPLVCRKAAQELKPSYVAQWCVQLAQLMNAFYREVNVLESQGTERAMRLRLIEQTVEVLGIALEIFGIPLPDEM